MHEGCMKIGGHGPVLHINPADPISAVDQTFAVDPGSHNYHNTPCKPDQPR